LLLLHISAGWIQGIVICTLTHEGQELFKKLLPALSVAISVAHTSRDKELYDETLGVHSCQTCWSDEPDYTVPSYDAAIYDLTLQDAVTVLPSHEPFNDPLKDVPPLSLPLPDSSVQEELSFEMYNRVTQAAAWPIFDQLDHSSGFSKRKLLLMPTTGLWNLRKSSTVRRNPWLQSNTSYLSC
jgi:hypothetical protein